jgi:hypothetical protein
MVKNHEVGLVFLSGAWLAFLLAAAWTILTTIFH